MSFDVSKAAAAAAAAVAVGGDQTKSVAGPKRELPVEGPGYCRLVGVIESGKHEKKFKNQAKVIDEVTLLFELVGKRHPATELPDGTKLPQVIKVTESLSLNEKANFFKLFQRLNYKQDAQHIAQLIGRGFKCEVIHDKWTGRDGTEQITATLKGAAGYTLAPPRREDDEAPSGWVEVEVAAAISPIRCFIWSVADLDQWASLFIEGEYPERKNDKGEVIAQAKSKNVWQARILSAKNFEGSAIHALLVANGSKLDIPDVAAEEEQPEGNEGGSGASGTAGPSHTAAQSSTTSPSNDALAGIV